MKFTDGNWLIRKGVHPSYAAQAYDVESSANSITVFATTSVINDRGQTLGGPALTVNIGSPMADVVRVKITHFSGEQVRTPSYVLEPATDHPVTVTDDSEFATVTSGRLTARIARGAAWELAFVADGRVVTRSTARGIGIADLDGDGAYIHEQLSLGVGENVYGLGERFTAFVKNGQVVEMWNKDGGTGSEQAYKNVPFYLTNRGYGVFVNHPEQVEFEAATEKVSRVQFSVPGYSLEYFVIYGPTPKEILQKYTALTGRPALPAPWSFGLWLTTSFTTSYDEETVTSFIEGMAARDLPLHVFHFDCFWMKEFHWCNFEWDERTFPDPAAMLRRLKDRGLKICVWINPYIAQRSAMFDEGKAGGYLLRNPDGAVWQTDQWQPGMGIVDFTNPEACAWYAGKLRALLDMGVDCFKTDFGERIPTEVVYHDGSDPWKMHNFYSYLYNKVVFDLLKEYRGEGDAVLFARSGTAGSQKFPVHWGGDCNSFYESMAESLRGGLSLCLSGFGFWSHDIGGFEGTPPADIYKRWIAFGLLSTHSRLHGSSSYRVPWLYDDEAVDVLRFFTKLKCSLMPNLFAAAVTAHKRGIPMLRAMILEYPDDPACEYLDRQYFLGDNLLVAPAFSKEGVVNFYLPDGHWTNYLTGDVSIGPRWVRETHDFLSIPLYVRPNSLLAVGAQNNRPDYDYPTDVTIELYQLEENGSASAEIHNQKGETAFAVQASRKGTAIQVTTKGQAPGWKLLLVGIQTIGPLSGASSMAGDRGITINPVSDHITFDLV